MSLGAGKIKLIGAENPYITVGSSNAIVLSAGTSANYIKLGAKSDLSDYNDSMVSLIPTTQYLHNDESGSFGTDVKNDALFEGVRNGMAMQIQTGTVLQLTVKGQSYIQPGHIIDFSLRPVEEEGMTSDKKSYDPQYSGRYVITKIRHRVVKQDYKMVLECRKDSVREQLPGKTTKTFSGISNNENAQFTKL